jgi:hypothetical protein
MDKQVLTRRGLFVLGIVAISGRAFASDEGHAGRSRHRGYKVGGGMVVLVIAAVAGTMALLGDFRRNRPGKDVSPPPAQLPEGEKWDGPADDGADDSHAKAKLEDGLRQRRARRKDAADSPKP